VVVVHHGVHFRRVGAANSTDALDEAVLEGTRMCRHGRGVQTDMNVAAQVLVDYLGG
jgi:hypothetical protein